MKLNWFFALLLCFVTMMASAQKEEYNPHSVRPIRKDDIMFKKALWFRMDLREKMNEPFYAQGNEITKILIDAVKSGKVKPFKNDSLKTRMSKADFMENLRIPVYEVKDSFDLEMTNEDAWGKKGAKKQANLEPDQQEYFPRQLYALEIKEDLIFDKRRSRMYHDILAITIIIPGEQTPTGIDKELGTFSYKELYESVFHMVDEETGRLIDNPEAIWFNRKNSAEHRNLADAFDLRLFSAGLVKYENPKNNTIQDMYGYGKKGLIASDQALYKLMEYEALLWSY